MTLGAGVISMPGIIPFGEMVRYHRKRSGLTQRELSDLAGVGMSSVFEIEKGKITVRLQTLMKVLEVLNISLEFNSPLMNEFRTRRDSVK
jgi:HTH-type transcriptional regulator/antitoxin HipB